MVFVGLSCRCTCTHMDKQLCRCHRPDPIESTYLVTARFARTEVGKMHALHVVYMSTWFFLLQPDDYGCVPVGVMGIMLGFKELEV